MSDKQIVINQTSGALSEADSLIATLPKWLVYLTGAFPAANVNKTTFLVYEDAFRDKGDDVMMAAIRDAVKNHKYASFPTIAEILKMIERTEWHKANTASPNLEAWRHVLLEQAYRGSINTISWKLLIARFKDGNCPHNAERMQQRLEQFQNAA